MIRTEVSFIGIESSRETVHIACGIGASTTSSNSRESRVHGCLFALFGKERGGGNVGPVAVGSECAVSSGASGVNSAFGNLRKRIVNICFFLFQLNEFLLKKTLTRS